MEADLKEVAACLDRTGLQFMATIGLDGRPKVRPVQFMVMEDGRLWFCTNSEKSMYAEMQRSPFVELCGSRLQDDEIRTVWIRLSAEAVFEENRKEKELIMEKSSIVRELYHDNPDHPLLKVFYLKGITGSMNNLGHVRGLEERDDFARPASFHFD